MDQETGRAKYDIPTPVAALVWVAVVAMALTASLIPTLRIPLGLTTVLILPITYAFVLALAGNVALRRPLGATRADPMSRRLSAALPATMLPFVILLGATVGQNWRAVVDAGPALILQEIGHFGGTVVLAFPIAVWLLRLGRETVGATFSIARESSVAIIAERYGLRSPEGTGVLAIYIIGTLAGTIIFSIIASFASGLDLFDHRALAVACGIGSGSMTAACAGALGVADPALAEEILALAGASNLLSTIGGFYIALFVTLPLVEWLFRRFGSTAPVAKGGIGPQADLTAAEPPTAQDRIAASLAMVLIPALAAKNLGTGLLASSVIVAFSWLAVAVNRLMRGRLPAIAWASVIGVALGALPPAAPLVRAAIGALDPLSLVLLPLSLAGFALGEREARAAQQIGWKLVVVALAVFVGTFVGAVLIAQATLGLH